MTIRRDIRRFGLAMLPLLLPWGAAVQGAQVDIGPELSRLAEQQGFTVTGAEHVAEAVGRAEGDEPVSRLRLLLERFDHIIVQADGGGIERVIILGRATPGAVIPKTAVGSDSGAGDNAEGGESGAVIELGTIRNGGQHSVRVTLEGAEGSRIERVLLIDTGADTLVLPESLISALGIDEESLGSREVQTANGRAQARVGSLSGLWLGEQRIPDVDVAFLGDDGLGSTGLLGMNVLGRYQMTIDDETNKLTLTKR
jgi:clan AA aspartic protease (TIGR02281 family)